MSKKAIMCIMLAMFSLCISGCKETLKESIEKVGREIKVKSQEGASNLGDYNIDLAKVGKDAIKDLDYSKEIGDKFMDLNNQNFDELMKSDKLINSSKVSEYGSLVGDYFGISNDKSDENKKDRIANAIYESWTKEYMFDKLYDAKGEKMLGENYNDNKEKFISDIKNNLDNMNIYEENGKIYLNYTLFDLCKVLNVTTPKSGEQPQKTIQISK